MEQYLDVRPMTIFEMRNPHYLQEIIKKLIEYEYNEELNKYLTEYYGGKK